MASARKILLPFSFLYGGLMQLRNKLYNKNILQRKRFALPVICVGNLAMGGTGKTPMIEYLIRLLKEDYEIAVLSRGYNRKSKGFRLVQGNELVLEVGDEPLQYKTKFPKIAVAVDEKRVQGIAQLLQNSTPPEIILLDDAFQHRKVDAGLNILLTSYKNLYATDEVLPAGNLREPKKGAQRAQIILVTKCPAELPTREQQNIAKTLALGENQALFFSTIAYEDAIFNASGLKQPLNSLKGQKFTLATGIANPKPLVEFLLAQGFEFKHLKFQDHHNFSASDIKKMNSDDFILTTEKDFMRLKNHISGEKLFYLPITTEFIAQEARFKRLIYNYIETEIG